MLAEIIRELTKCEENVTISYETALAWAKRVEEQRAQKVVISSLQESKTFIHSHMKKIDSGMKSMQATQTLPEKDGNTVDKSINQDDSWYMAKGVTNEARSSTLKWYAEGPGPAQSMLLRKKIFMSKNLTLE